MKLARTVLIASIVMLYLCTGVEAGWAALWGPVQAIEFEDGELPDNLYAEFMGVSASSFLEYCLPVSYTRSKDYPLIVYVPGFHGHRGGNIENAMEIAEGQDCVVLSLPLFQADVDRSEIGKGISISFADYPVLSSAYELMFQSFYEAVPNIDHSRSAMVGYSNGATAIAVLVSSHDRYILERFHSFCLVDHGMFHLTDLYKDPTRDRRFLIMVGDRADYGRELKLRGAQLVADSYQLLGISVESRILPNTGHELTAACKKDIGAWIAQ